MEVKTGFLSPEGKLYKCCSYEHLTKACKICDSLNIKYVTSVEAEQELFKLGWIAIRAKDLCSTIIYHRNRIYLTEKQEKYLLKIYEDMNEGQRKYADELIDDHKGWAEDFL